MLTSAGGAGGAYTRRGGDDVRVAVWAMAGPLMLTFAMSVVETTAALVGCLNSDSALYQLLLGRDFCTSYSISLGIVSGSLILIYAVLFALVPQRMPDKSLLVLGLILVIWWGCGVAATTFQSSSLPDAGYFASWAALVYSAFVLHAEWEQFRLLTARLADVELHTRAGIWVMVASVVRCSP